VADIDIRHPELAKRGITPMTQKKVFDGFRAFLRWAAKRDPLVEIPQFSKIEVSEHAPRIIRLEEQA
jgi:hypothetical protein